MLDTGAGEPSSNLAKGVAKEKELARDLRVKNPSATVTRTPQTGDGGKDLILESGKHRLYYEVKNWERPMSVYDLDRYITLHKNSDADVIIFNQGGFSDEARQLGAKTGVELMSGSDYTSPGSREVGRWYLSRIRSVASKTSRKTASRIFRGAIRIGGESKRFVYQGTRCVAKSIYNTIKKVYKKLSFRQVAILGVIFGPIWLYIKWRNDEYSHRDALKLVGGVSLCLVLHSIFER
jgi:hypothetical protein